MRVLFVVVLLYLAAGCRYGISGPYPDFTYRPVAVQKVPRSILSSFKAQQPEAKIESVETASFRDEILQYRFRFVTNQGQSGTAVFDSESRSVAPPGLFRPDSGSANSQNIERSGECGPPTAP